MPLILVRQIGETIVFEVNGKVIIKITFVELVDEDGFRLAIEALRQIDIK